MGDDGRDDEARQALEGVFSINFFRPESKPAYRQLKEDIATYQGLYFNSTPSVDDVVFQGAILYDSVFLYAKAAGDVIRAGGDPFNGSQIVTAAKALSFEVRKGGGISNWLD